MTGCASVMKKYQDRIKKAISLFKVKMKCIVELHQMAPIGFNDFSVVAAGVETTVTLSTIFTFLPDLNFLPITRLPLFSVCLSISVFLLPAWLCHLSGPPGPPTSIQVEEITDTTASLSWRPGPDNHSPITAYTIQARTPFSLGWQAVTTGKLSPTSRGRLQSHGGGRSSFCLACENIGDVILPQTPNVTQL